MTAPLINIFKENQKQFDRYRNLLLKWNEKINLTAITNGDQIDELHFLDSLGAVVLLRELRNVSRETHMATLLDIGAGGGFPGIPIKIACSDMKVILVDSVKKKCDFMKTVIRDLQLKEIEVVHQNVTGSESLGQFDFIISRAAFKMRELINITIPYLSPNGWIIGMKSTEVENEIADCSAILESNNLEPIQQKTYQLPYSHIERKLLLTHKAFSS